VYIGCIQYLASLNLSVNDKTTATIPMLNSDFFDINNINTVTSNITGYNNITLATPLEYAVAKKKSNLTTSIGLILTAQNSLIDRLSTATFDTNLTDAGNTNVAYTGTFSTTLEGQAQTIAGTALTLAVYNNDLQAVTKLIGLGATIPGTTVACSERQFCSMQVQA